mmetsp:Transcript_5612/g.17687  ORF Transcript_5612/g.17687 Transcript_5612/m.17687 type:complete len:344 (-) Transcript_5612:32-1063(-)
MRPQSSKNRDSVPHVAFMYEVMLVQGKTMDVNTENKEGGVARVDPVSVRRSEVPWPTHSGPRAWAGWPGLLGGVVLLHLGGDVVGGDTRLGEVHLLDLDFLAGEHRADGAELLRRRGLHPREQEAGGPAARVEDVGVRDEQVVARLDELPAPQRRAADGGHAAGVLALVRGDGAAPEVRRAVAVVAAANQEDKVAAGDRGRGPVLRMHELGDGRRLVELLEPDAVGGELLANLELGRADEVDELVGLDALQREGGLEAVVRADLRAREELHVATVGVLVALDHRPLRVVVQLVDLLVVTVRNVVSVGEVADVLQRPRAVERGLLRRPAGHLTNGAPHGVETGN